VGWIGVRDQKPERLSLVARHDIGCAGPRYFEHLRVSCGGRDRGQGIHNAQRAVGDVVRTSRSGSNRPVHPAWRWVCGV
jgi:hypothetical protein